MTTLLNQKTVLHWLYFLPDGIKDIAINEAKNSYPTTLDAFADNSIDCYNTRTN